jgi:hypothetical protein
LLKALVATGATEHEARLWAPWITTPLLRTLAAEIDAVPMGYWSPERLGKLVELTNQEREAEELWQLRPCDVDWHLVQAREHERRKARNRARARMKREALNMTKQLARDLDVREESVLVAIGTKWTPVSKVIDMVRGGRAWQALVGSSLKVIMHRVLDKLVAQGLVESKIAVGTNCLPTRFVRVTR